MRPCGLPKGAVWPPEPKDCPVTTAKTTAAPAAKGSPVAHPSLRELDRPVNLTGAQRARRGQRRGRRDAAAA